MSNVESQGFTPKLITPQAGDRTAASGMLSGRANHYTAAPLFACVPENVILITQIVLILTLNYLCESSFMATDVFGKSNLW